MRILLVEDDGQLSESLVDALTAQNYVVDAVRDGEMGWHQLQTSEYDLALLDVTLPKLEGSGSASGFEIGGNRYQY